MASNYPSSLDAFTTGVLAGVVSGTDHGNKGDAINKIEAELGIDPSGSAATVKARLDSVESGRLKLAPGTVGEGTLTLPAGDTTVGLRLIREGSGELFYAGRSAFAVGSSNFRDLHMDTNYQLGFRRGFLREIGDVASLAFGRAGPDGGLATDTPTSLVGDSVVGYQSFLAYCSTDAGFWSPSGYNAHIAIAYGRLKGTASATNRGGEYTIGTQNQNATPTLEHHDRLTVEHDGKVHVRPATNAAGTAVAATDNLRISGAISGNGITIGDSSLYWAAANSLEFGGHLGVNATFRHMGSNLGFYNTSPVAKPSGVAVTAAAIHAALVSLGLIAA